MEQTVLLDAATAYMDVLRDAAILELQRRNLDLLRQQLDLTRNRQAIGEVTTTDIAQVQSRLAAARTEVATAQAAYNTSCATFERVIGSEPESSARAPRSIGLPRRFSIEPLASPVASILPSPQRLTVWTSHCCKRKSQKARSIQW